MRSWYPWLCLLLLPGILGCGGSGGNSGVTSSSSGSSGSNSSSSSSSSSGGSSSSSGSSGGAITPLDPAPLQGRWSGTWTAPEASASGTARIDVTVDTGAKIIGSLATVTGNIFGSNPPPPVTLSSTYDDNGVAVDTQSPSFGHVAGSLSPNGTFRGSVTDIPDARISRADITGIVSGDTVWATFTLTLSPSSGGRTIQGSVTLTKQQQSSLLLGRPL